jgi:hypothetical protein
MRAVAALPGERVVINGAGCAGIETARRTTYVGPEGGRG